MLLLSLCLSSLTLRRLLLFYGLPFPCCVFTVSGPNFAFAKGPDLQGINWWEVLEEVQLVGLERTRAGGLKSKSCDKGGLYEIEAVRLQL